MKIGMYTDEEILEHLTEGEGRGFLGRSMYDAIVEKINKKEAMYDSLAVDYRLAQEEIERLNNDIKILLQENGNKEKVIKAQDNIIKEAREYVSRIIIDETYTKCISEILDKVGVDKE